MLLHILKRQLVRNRLYDRKCISENCTVYSYNTFGECVKVGVVYQTECEICNKAYVVETETIFAVHIREDMASKRSVY